MLIPPSITSLMDRWGMDPFKNAGSSLMQNASPCNGMLSMERNKYKDLIGEWSKPELNHYSLCGVPRLRNSEVFYFWTFIEIG